MSRELPKLGGTFIQAESEIASINMLLGASACGVRAMTSSSGPGISLKQEGISYMAGSELPGLIVNIARSGPGLGGIDASQADYWQSVKGGGHGGYRIIVLAPHSAQEMYEHAILAFDLADRYRLPAMVMADAVIGQMKEALVPHPYVAPDRSAGEGRGRWPASEGRGRQTIVKSLYPRRRRTRGAQLASARQVRPAGGKRGALRRAVPGRRRAGGDRLRFRRPHRPHRRAPGARRRG